MNYLFKIKNCLNNPTIKNIIRVGTEVSPAIVAFSGNPSFWNGFRFTFTLCKAIIDRMEVWADYFTRDDNWSEPFSRDFINIIINVLNKFPHEIIKTSIDGKDIVIVTVPDGKIGWYTSAKFLEIENIYVEAINSEKIKNYIKKLLWEKYNGKSLVFSKENIQRSNNISGASFNLNIDDIYNIFQSKIADECISTLSRALNVGINRSIMLYGPPGTGKSTAARTIINNLNLCSFRIRVEDLNYMANSTLFEAIEIFKPDAIILDDFDRCLNQTQLLEVLEYFQRHIKLVIATVNNRNNLDEALLRPGRFDELILVNQMDNDIILNILGQENIDQFEKLKNWPIAFIQEFIKRCKFMSKDEAINSIQELAERVERLNEYNEDNGFSKIRSNLIKNNNIKMLQ